MPRSPRQSLWKLLRRNLQRALYEVGALASVEFEVLGARALVRGLQASMCKI